MAATCALRKVVASFGEVAPGHPVGSLSNWEESMRNTLLAGIALAALALSWPAAAGGELACGPWLSAACGGWG